MSELNKTAIAMAERASREVNRLGAAAASESLVEATVAQAMATAALVQATEAQTKAIEQQTAAILKSGGRR